MVRYLVASLRLFGGPTLRNASVVVTVGADEASRDLRAELSWSKSLDIEWRWLPRPLYRAHSYYATAAERFRYKFRSDLVLMLDADTLIAGFLTELCARPVRDGRFYGLIAHLSPFAGIPNANNAAMWDRIFNSAGLDSPSLNCEYTGWGRLVADPAWRFCPPYFSLGVLIARADQMSAIGATIYEDMAAVDRALDTVYKCQLAVSLALARARIPTERLELKFNYPNTMLPEAAYALPAKALADIRIFHYLGTGEVDKTRDFADESAVARLLRRRDLNRANQALQTVVRRVHYRAVSPLSRAGDLMARVLDRGDYTAPSLLQPIWEMILREENQKALSLLAPFRSKASVNSDVWYLSALSAQRIGRLADAERWYARALVLGHDDFWVRFNRASLYLRLGKPGEARADLVSVIRARPEHPSTRALITHFESVAPAVTAGALESDIQ